MPLVNKIIKFVISIVSLNAAREKFNILRH